MIEEDCGGEVSPTQSGKNDQQFGSPSQGDLAPSSSSSTTCGGIESSWVLSYGFFLKNSVDEQNQIVQQPIPICGIVLPDDDEATDGVDERTFAEFEVVGVPDQNYEVTGENQGLQDLQDSNNVDERQGSEINFCGEPPPPGDLEECLSQGTSSSIRNLFNDTEGMEESSSKISRILQAGCTGIHGTLHDMIKVHFNDEHGTKRFLSHIIKDVMCTSFYKGACQPSSDEAEKLENEFEKLASKDKYKLLGMIGKVLLEKYCASLESGESQEFCSEEMDALDIGNNSITMNNVDTTDLGRKFHQRTFEDERMLDIKPNLLNGLPSVPNYIHAAEVEEPCSSKKPRKSTVKKVRVSKESVWDEANDARKENENNKDRQVEKIGIVFYEDIFTENEKRTCTVSGKNKTDIFDRTKLRFIRAAIAFILTDPLSRNTKAFEKARKENGFVDLTAGEYGTFRKRVLTEHAYRLRKRSAK